MKICPVCQTSYDDFQNFCLNDGTPLANFTGNEPQQVQPLEPETVIQPDEPATVVTVPSSSQSNLADGQRVIVPHIIQRQPPVVVEKKSNTGKIVLLTALTTILLAALVGGGIYLAMRNRGTQIAKNNDNQNVNKPKNTNTSNANAANLNKNANAALDSNLNTNAASPSPSPKPTLSAEQAAKVKKDVNKALEGWDASTENGDINEHMDFYADTVDYYNNHTASANIIRADRQNAFNTYPDMEVKLSNIKITPDSSGEKATVILDKTWRFGNDSDTSEGSVQQQLTLTKINGRWLITGEKDLKVHYKTKY